MWHLKFESTQDWQFSKMICSEKKIDCFVQFPAAASEATLGSQFVLSEFLHTVTLLVSQPVSIPAASNLPWHTRLALVSLWQAGSTFHGR